MPLGSVPYDLRCQVPTLTLTLTPSLILILTLPSLNPPSILILTELQYTAAAALSEVALRSGGQELSTDLVYLVFSFLRVRVERRVLVSGAARE